jgi:hypothetical protein
MARSLCNCYENVNALDMRMKVFKARYTESISHKMQSLVYRTLRNMKYYLRENSLSLILSDSWNEEAGPRLYCVARSFMCVR